MYNDLTATSILKLMPSRKTDIKSFHEAIKQQLLNGEVYPLELLANLKIIERTLKSIFADNKITEVFLDSMGGDDKRDAYGCTFKVKESGVTYDYSVSNDWCELDNQIKELTEKRKDIEDMLKRSNHNASYVDISTGQAINGIDKKSKTILEVTIK